MGCFYDARGRWLATSSGKFIKNANNADREYFIYHQNRDDGGLYIGKVIRSRTTGDLIIPVSRRFNNPDGSFGGVVLATLYIDYFRQFYDSFALNTDASLNLLLADGTILYRRPYSAASIGKTSPRVCCSAKFCRIRNSVTPPSPRCTTKWSASTAIRGSTAFRW